MEGRFDEVKDSLSIKDPRQLMRQHTGEAYVKLSFEGSDGVTYEAQWSVARARKKENAKLQDRQWSLLNLQSGQLLTKVQEVKAAIQAAVQANMTGVSRYTFAPLREAPMERAGVHSTSAATPAFHAIPRLVLSPCAK